MQDAPEKLEGDELEALIKEASKTLETTKFQLMALKNSTFTTSVLFQLKIIFTQDVPTAMVDIEKIQMNPKYFLEMGAMDRISLLAKLTWHIILDHPARFNDMKDSWEFERFAKAADHVVNTMLKEKGYKIPEGWHCDDNFKDKSTEHVYKLLEDPDNDDNKQNTPQFSNGGGGQSGQDNNPNPPPVSGNDPNHQQRLREMLTQADTQNKLANDAQKEAGLGQNLEDRLAKYKDPKVPWNVHFAQYLFDTIKSDFSFRRPNKRFLPDYILPSPHGEGIHDFGVGIDVSGSVSQEEFNDFITESQSMKDLLNPQRTEVVQWHSHISDITTLNENEDFDSVEFKETGGTDIYPLMRHWIENPPKVAVIFTDGYFHMWNKPEEITFPVIWVIHSNDNFKPPFGEVVYYEPDLD